jgi:GNAT superfamily N-acetyltransferase
LNTAAAEPLLRKATRLDESSIGDLIRTSVRSLSRGYYTPEQAESGLRFVFGVDTQLIVDGTYFMIEVGDQLVAAGGWSARRTLFGGDQMKTGEDDRLDPTTEPARIRAFFVHPDWTRRGLARRIFERCEWEAASSGFTRFELLATLPGEPLYTSLGFVVEERVEVALPDGVILPCARMSRPIPERSTSSPTAGSTRRPAAD